jgi:glucose-1-phosphate adenylyltransferase
MALASMGIYVFDTRYLFDRLAEDAADPNSSHDFGKDLIPRLVVNAKAVAHPFQRSCVRSTAESVPYWRDVGTLDSYFAANIDLTDIVPDLDLFDRDWPIWTYGEMTAPAKFVHDEDGRRGQAISSVIAGGSIISGATLRRSLVFTGVRVHSYADVAYAVIMPDVDIGTSAHLRNVIIERGVRIPDGLVVGQDPVLDAKRFRRTANGVCLITQPMIDGLRG